MTGQPKLLFFAGSTRSGSLNARLARLAYEIAQANGIASTLADLADYRMPLYDGDLENAGGPPEAAVRFKQLLKEHQGVMIAAPEYNAGITPLLKNTLDWTSRVREGGESPLAVFQTRVFALIAASPGGYGGMRGLLMVRNVLMQGLGAMVLPDQLAVARANEAFDEHGHLADKAAQERLKAIIQRLARAAQRLAD
jgi:NAD(P)H-dependent FMN reductase